MISYDTNVLIYALEDHPEFSVEARRIVLRGEKEGAVLTILAIQEILTGAAIYKKDAVAIRSALADFLATDFIDVNEEVVNIAMQLTEKYGKKCMGYDAIHVATALQANATVFYTNDQDILSSGITEITIKGIS